MTKVRREGSDLTERRASLLASSLIARWHVATDPEFMDTPIVREQLDAFEEIKSVHRQLMARGLPSADVLARLRDWCADRKMPLIDTLRVQNGLTETFGAQCVRESVERELTGPPQARSKNRFKDAYLRASHERA